MGSTLAIRGRRSRIPYFELRSSEIQGTGAFAIRTIRKGTRIIEYLGQRISWRTADKRYDDEKMSRHHTFLFTVDDKTVIDAAVSGNDARFLNHSCDPNCEAINDRKRIFIEAAKTIPAGTELVYDYQYERTDDHTGGGREVLRLPLRLAEVPRDDPGTEAEKT